jgi:FAD/FMN-containing dehydrogenase
LTQSLERFDALLSRCDYVVGWIDAFARGRALGRGEIHGATYLDSTQDPLGRASLSSAAQELPSRLFGIPREEMWKLMRLFTNAPAMSLVNAAKYRLAQLNQTRSYLQSHAAFAFLLDYIPDWRLAYGDGGFIQHQLFVPREHAESCLNQVLLTCQASGHVPYLAVLKRHRKDDFLLSHSLDGWSLALDFCVTDSNRRDIWSLSERLTEQVLEVGGKFYFAKDAVLRPKDVVRAYGRDRVEQFLSLKQKLDPSGLFGSDLFERVFSRSSQSTEGAGPTSRNPARESDAARAPT